MISGSAQYNKIEGLGIDVSETARFSGMKKKHFFLKKVFTARELSYCFSYRFPALRLAGLFSAKEAVVKASGGKWPILRLEVRHDTAGAPKIYVGGKLKKNVLVSISHSKVNSCAIALMA